MESHLHELWYELLLYSSVAMDHKFLAMKTKNRKNLEVADVLTRKSYVVKKTYVVFWLLETTTL